MKPICVPCRRFFRVRKNGFYFLEGMPAASDTPPGNAEPENWKPYKLWVGDLWECQGCGAQIIKGTPSDRLAEHYEQDFGERVLRTGADQFQVNDC